MNARRFVAPVLAGAAVGLVATTLGIVAYNCLHCWYLGASGDPRCVYAFKNYVEVYANEHGAAKVSCRYEPDFPGAAP